jgi:predicted TIM-barrel fold metal-dependent hydrolase
MKAGKHRPRASKAPDCSRPDPQLRAQRSYTSRPALEADYLAVNDAVSIQRGILVQVSMHGTDNRSDHLVWAGTGRPCAFTGPMVNGSDLLDLTWPKGAR